MGSPLPSTAYRSQTQKATQTPKNPATASWSALDCRRRVSQMWMQATAKNMV